MQKIVQKIITVTLLCFAVSSLAAVPPMTPPVPYISYNYDMWDSSAPAYPSYDAQKTVNGWHLGIGPMNNPKDLCKDDQGNLYILDSGNKRIIIIDKLMNLTGVIETFYFEDEAFELIEPAGIYVDAHKSLYIADRGAKAVFVCSLDGVCYKIIRKPVTDLIDENTDFIPDKVLADSAGVIYVLSFGAYEGAYTFDQQGDFLGFFGSNKVNVNQKLLSDRMWRFFATKEQQERMYRYVPVEYANFCIDKEGFIYTVSNFGDNEQRGQVRKLNPLSQNILFYIQKPNLMFFGDFEYTYTNRIEKSTLIALDVDDYGFIFVLDFERGRIFQYDQSCNLISIFGGTGNQTGAFRNAADLVSIENTIYVLDNVKGSVTSFTPTRFGKAVRSATILYEEGFYEQALEPWYEALKLDRNNYLILRGLGRAYERLNDYETSMYYYKEAQFHRFYSDSFLEWRTAFLREHFVVFMLCIVFILAAPPLISHSIIKRRKTKPVERAVYVKALQFPFYLIAHPGKGWEELKDEKQGSLLLANIILLLSFLMSIIQFQATGFIFNPNKLDEMNLLINFASTIGIFTLWCIANWAICTLLDGKGTFKEIWIFSAYSRLFYVLSVIPIVLLSNMLTRDEGLFLTIFETVQIGYSVFMMTAAVKAVHQYTFKKTVFSMALTVAGIVLIIVIILLFFSLFSQIWSFGSTLVQEILMRM